MTIIGISRSISACKRCRNKKIKCSQEFPKCKACQKANAECVSLDPATGKEIPRSYIMFLENKISQLENQLKITGGSNVTGSKPVAGNIHPSATTVPPVDHTYGDKRRSDSPPTSDSDFSAHNNISFSKLMFVAVHYNDKKEGKVDSNIPPQAKIDPTSIPVSSQSKKIALLPPKQQALDFIYLYFSKSNSQLPIFHRIEFLEKYFIPIYGSIPENLNLLRDFEDTNGKLKNFEEKDTWYYQYITNLDKKTKENPEMDPFEFAASVTAPDQFKIPLFFMNIVFAISSSIYHLQFPGEISENFKNSALVYIEDVYSNIDRLEALKAMLCLTLFSLMRPCIPGVWYLLGSSLRLCVDLNLHNENNSSSSSFDAFTIDMRRRLFWCCYSLDRQICVYLNRPFGIPEESINVKFFSLLDDELIKKDCTPKFIKTLEVEKNRNMKSYKFVAITMIKIRQLQAEILSILYEKKEIPRCFPNLTAWLIDIDSRLDNWKASVVKIANIMDCEFTSEFFDLNYYHAKIMLNGLSPNRYVLTNKDLVDAADAAKGMISTYHALLKRGALNYTWAATQNIFMAHMSYLYSIFNNNFVKNENSLEEVIKLSSYSNSILKSLVDKCNAASECLEILSILSQAVLKLKYDMNTNKTETEDVLKSQPMKNLPSENDIQSVQAGGNMNANMRRLVVSIPELINQKNDEQEELQKGGNKKRQKLTYFNSNAFDDVLSWDTKEFDLEKFFDKVHTVDTPTSIRSNTNNRFPTTLEASGDPLIVQESESYDSYGASSSILTSALNSTISDLRSSSNNSTNLGSFSSSYPAIPYYSPNEVSVNNNIAPAMASPLDFFNSFSYSQTSHTPPVANSSNMNRTANKEGSMVYKMMFEAGSESIWNQFFAQPFKTEDI